MKIKVGQYYRLREQHPNFLSENPKCLIIYRNRHIVKLIGNTRPTCDFIGIVQGYTGDSGECYYTESGLYAGGKGCSAQEQIRCDFEKPHPYDLIEHIRQSDCVVQVQYKKLESLEAIALLVHERSVRKIYDREGMCPEGLRSLSQIESDLEAASHRFHEMAEKV